MTLYYQDDYVTPKQTMSDDEIDLYYCLGCEGDTRSDDHFGCTYCSNCTCEGGC